MSVTLCIVSSREIYATGFGLGLADAAAVPKCLLALPPAVLGRRALRDRFQNLQLDGRQCRRLEQLDVLTDTVPLAPGALQSSDRDRLSTDPQLAVENEDT